MVEKGKWVLVTDLDTGGQTLQRSRRSAEGKTVKPSSIRQWWDQTGSTAFKGAAEGWRQNRAAEFAGEFGYDVEGGGPLMNAAEKEELLRKAFGAARSLRITSLDITRKMKSAIQGYRERFGAEADWLPGFADSAIDLLSEVYGLGQERTEALKKCFHKPHSLTPR